MLGLGAMGIAPSRALVQRFNLRITATSDDKLFQIFQEKGVILFRFCSLPILKRSL
jgi:hypothetical protein